MIYKRFMSTVMASTLGSLAAGSVAVAQDDGGRGLEIAIEAERRDSGFGDFTSEMTMVLRNRHGEESTREIRNRTLEVLDDGDKTLVIFDRPRDVQGTALLSFSHRIGSDDQWLYLPALRRVKRIASNNKAGPFMGSEFAYEDISSQEVEKYSDYRFVSEEDLDGTPTFVVERVPVDENSGYTRQLVWFDQVEYRVMKVDFYDRRNVLMKTLSYAGYQQYEGRYWRADQMDMVNHQTGKSTTLMWRNFDFGTGLSDRDFDQNSLRRAR